MEEIEIWQFGSRKGGPAVQKLKRWEEIYGIYKHIRAFSYYKQSKGQKAMMMIG